MVSGERNMRKSTPMNLYDSTAASWTQLVPTRTRPAGITQEALYVRVYVFTVCLQLTLLFFFYAGSLCEKNYQKTKTGCEPCAISESTSGPGLASTIALAVAIFAIALAITICVLQLSSRPAKFHGGNQLRISGSKDITQLESVLKATQFFASMLC